jgi:ribosomal protein S5
MAMAASAWVKESLKEVPVAVQKAMDEARRKMIKVPLARELYSIQLLVSMALPVF